MPVQSEGFVNGISIDELVECEFAQFSANLYRGLATAEEFELVEGRVPVLVSAPHAVTHIRNGAIKPSEDFTGAIALAVARASGCHAMVATRTVDEDPNWSPFEHSPYKQALCPYVREKGISCVIDIHGMVAASEALLAVGSADGETVATSPGLDERVTSLLRDRLGAWCERYEKPIVLNGRYGARSGNTIARTVARECGVATLQIEIATQMRVPVRYEGGRIPRDEPIPFSSTQLPVELAVRRSADPAAVMALIDALVEAVDLARSSS